MKAIVLVAVVCALMACTKTSAWTVAQTDLYRVSGYLGGEPHAEQTSPKPYFLVKKVVGSANSAVSENVVQYQVVWCDNLSSCNDRDYSIQVVQYRGAPEDDRSTFEAGAKCTIVRHSLSGEQITIKSDTYTSKQFSPEECEAGVTGPLPPKFVRSSSKTITGQLVQAHRR